MADLQVQNQASSCRRSPPTASEKHLQSSGNTLNPVRESPLGFLPLTQCSLEPQKDMLMSDTVPQSSIQGPCSESTTQPSALTFHCFPKLPPELRNRIWALRYSSMSQVIEFEIKIRKYRDQGGRPSAEKTLYLTRKSIRQVNVCHEEREEILRQFRITKLVSNDSGPFEFPLNRDFVFSAHDIAKFRNCQQTLDYCRDGRHGRLYYGTYNGSKDPRPLINIQHLVIEEVITKSPQPCEDLQYSSTNLDQLKGLLNAVANLLPNLKSLTILKLAYSKKVMPTKGEGRRTTNWQLMDNRDGEIVLKYIRRAMHQSAIDKPSHLHPVVKVLSHSSQPINLLGTCWIPAPLILDKIQNNVP